MPNEPFVGNRAASRRLELAALHGSLSHAYVFSGPQGVGKKLMAKRLAKFLLCKGEKSGLAACGECRPCRKVDSGCHPDLQVVSPETKVFKVEQIREIIRDICYLPTEGSHRVFILDEADRMNEEASNALLKTLEEPPEKSVLALITSNLYGLLPTIRSRCTEVKFLPVPPVEIESFLSSAKGLDAGHARAAARVSFGSVGAALSLDPEKVYAMQAKALDLASAMTVYGDARAMGLVQDLVGGGGKSEEQAGESQPFDLFLHIFVSILRDLVIMDHCCDREHVLNWENLDRLTVLKRHFTMERIDLMLGDIGDFHRKRPFNLRMDVAFLNFVLRHREAMVGGRL